VFILGGIMVGMLFTTVIALQLALEVTDNLHVMGVTRLDNGNTLLCYSKTSFIAKYQKGLIENRSQPILLGEHAVIEVTPQGQIVWSFSDVVFPHEAIKIPNGNIWIADTINDRMIEVNPQTNQIEWEWNPHDVNWTEINPEWDENSWYMNPTPWDWSHLNDVDYKKYNSSFEACLISLRNFDTIVEINYTAEIAAGQGNWGNASNIVWLYGERDNYTLLNHQHNPDYLDSGNIVVSDSENARLLELDYSSGTPLSPYKQIVWSYSGGLRWPRDINEVDGGQAFIVTDSLNGRIFKVTRAKQIIWQFTYDLISPYETKILDNGNILIGNAFNGMAMEITPFGASAIVTWSYGIPAAKAMQYYIYSYLIGCCVGIIVILKLLFEKKFLSYWMIPSIVGIILCVLLMCFYTVTTSATIIFFRDLTHALGIDV